MTMINLLPWREKLRQKQKKDFLVLLSASVVVAVIFVACAYLVMKNLVYTQIAVNKFYQEQNMLLDKQIQQVKDIKKIKANLLARMQVIQNLERTRPSIVHMLDDLVRIVPESVHITKLEKEGNVITLVGEAESNSRVSTLMRNIESSPWMADPVLTEIKSDNTDDQYSRNFTVQMTQIIPADHPLNQVFTEQGVADGAK
jgi:type IV pilus assembly protein PilN